MCEWVQLKLSSLECFIKEGNLVRISLTFLLPCLPPVHFPFPLSFTFPLPLPFFFSLLYERALYQFCFSYFSSIIFVSFMLRLCTVNPLFFFSLLLLLIRLFRCLSRLCSRFVSMCLHGVRITLSFSSLFPFWEGDPARDEGPGASGGGRRCGAEKGLSRKALAGDARGIHARYEPVTASDNGVFALRCPRCSWAARRAGIVCLIRPVMSRQVDSHLSCLTTSSFSLFFCYFFLFLFVFWRGSS